MSWFAKAEDLVLAYGNHVAMSASSFTLPAQSVVAIIGPNGSGKSTLLHALAGVIEPRSGSLTITELPEAGHRISYVMQSVQYPEGTPITVRETVAMGRYAQLGWFGRMGRSDRAKVAEAMERLEITDLAKRHLGELSGGQRQRVYVAQGLAQGHEVLLLDEPLTGLDLLSARKIDKIIHDEREHGHTVVLTTHDLDEARAADHVVLMSGRVVANGTPEEVLTRHNLEIAYGLGALHDHEDRINGGRLFLDDPTHPKHD
ncbi:metal ABC transporter ATP-binding protein [Enemella sp. A6]|uniref:metal ABC transporter ATP-binding protein n=1 Tax=Enemella sp. A6 TaxID=3440152 RepID=UPI003EBA3932